MNEIYNHLSANHHEKNKTKKQWVKNKSKDQQ